MNRNDIISDFLKSNIKGNLNIEEIPADASFRQYSRVNTKSKTFILMDCPNPEDNFLQFIKVNEILEDIGVKCPQIISSDKDNGLLLLEDLGEGKLNKILSNQFYNEIEFYRNTVNILIHIHKKTKDKTLDLPKYDTDILLQEAMLFIDWYLPLFEDIKDNRKEDIKNEFKQNISSLCKSLYFKNNTLILRDFHADNLFYTPDEKGVKKIAVIDHQDALIGNPTYDLLSLLEDARRDVNKYLQQDMINYYIHQIEVEDESKEFIQDYKILASIRNLKILGIFCRLKVRDKKDKYIELIPRVKNYLLNDLEHSALNELKYFLEKTCKTI